MPRPVPRHVLWTFRLVTLVLATLLFCAAAEVGLRLAWGGYYLSPPSGMRTRRSLTRVWENRPGVRFTYGEPEFHHLVTHESHGFRGPEVAPAPAPGKRRVLVLGDSFVWGVGAADDETIPARLAAHDPSLEAVNTGVIGYGTQHELLLLRDQGFAVSPSAVALFFFWNDLEDVLHASEAGFTLAPDGALTFARPRPSEEALHDPGPRGPGLLERSYLYRFASDAGKTLRFRLEIALREEAHKPGHMAPADQERAWALVRALLSAMRDDCRACGVPLVLAAIPDQSQVHPEWPVMGLGEQIPGVPAKVCALARDLGIPAVDLTPALLEERKARPGVPLYYRRDRHFTPAGYDVAARATLPALQEALAHRP